jgi:hypothetical protein
LPRFIFVALQYARNRLFVQRNIDSESIMSKQLTLASALSIFALSALALFASTGHLDSKTGATSELAAPALVAELPLD